MRRAIIETSNMSNNDEVFVHYDSEDLLEAVVEELKKPPFSTPRVVMRRELTQEEFDCGLAADIRYWTTDDVFNNPSIFPDLTVALDWAGKLNQYVNSRCATFNMSPSEAVADTVATNYYDCMSGGCSGYYLAMCRYLIERYNLDLDTYVYPCASNTDKDYHTLGDFLKEIEKIPRYELGLLKDHTGVLLLEEQ